MWLADEFDILRIKDSLPHPHEISSVISVVRINLAHGNWFSVWTTPVNISGTNSAQFKAWNVVKDKI
jgi:hypothetical protein